jgi:hypothetical protein
MFPDTSEPNKFISGRFKCRRSVEANQTATFILNIKGNPIRLIKRTFQRPIRRMIGITAMP